MKKTKIISLLVICILFVIFVLQNSTVIRTKFLFFEWNMPKALLICLSVMVGVVLGILASMRKP
ncbi:MAG: LapA family protein [Chlamydiae bacterium]|nr:LapA family protein [Chlamydiota bacterium]